MLGFSFKYLLAFLFFLGIEIVIAKYATDFWIRGVMGDVLVVMLIYSFVKIFLKKRWAQTAIVVLIFAYVVEFSQYLELVKNLGIEDQKWAQLILGSSFDWIDLLAYTFGIAVLLYIEFVRIVRKEGRSSL